MDRNGTRRALLILMILWSGCDWLWPDDGKYDPRRCDPRCRPGSMCVEGQCVNDKTQDAGVDAGGDRGTSDTASPDAQDLSPKPDKDATKDMPVADVLLDMPAADAPLDMTSDSPWPDLHPTPDITAWPDKAPPPDTTPWPDQFAWLDQKVPKCGDKYIDSNEQCDGTNLGGTTCKMIGFTAGTLACKGCKYDTSACEKCGDGKITASEKCEGKNLGGNSCSKIGFDAGWLTCKKDCSLDTSQCYKVLDTTAIAVTPPTNWTGRPAVASNGSIYMVVWSDDRNKAKTSYDIYGVRIDGSGKVLDAKPFVISQSVKHERLPEIASDGKGFLVTWEERTKTGVNAYDVFGARVDASGKVLDVKGISLAATADDEGGPKLAYDGTNNYMVVWGQAKSGSVCQAVARRVSTASGKVVDAAPIVLSGAAKDGCQKPSIAFNGTNYLVAWGWGEISAALVAPNGTIVNKSIPVTASKDEEWGPMVASDGKDFMVAWQETPYWRWRYTMEDDVEGRQISSTGKVLGTTPHIFDYGQDKNCQDLYVMFDGSRYLVFWLTVSNPMMGGPFYYASNIHSVDSAGVQRGFYLQLPKSSGHKSQMRAAANGSGQLLFVWKDSKYGAMLAARVKY